MLCCKVEYREDRVNQGWWKDKVKISAGADADLHSWVYQAWFLPSWNCFSSSSFLAHTYKTIYFNKVPSGTILIRKILNCPILILGRLNHFSTLYKGNSKKYNNNKKLPPAFIYKLYQYVLNDHAILHNAAFINKYKMHNCKFLVWHRCVMHCNSFIQCVYCIRGRGSTWHTAISQVG